MSRQGSWDRAGARTVVLARTQTLVSHGSGLLRAHSATHTCPGVCAPSGEWVSEHRTDGGTFPRLRPSFHLRLSRKGHIVGTGERSVVGLGDGADCTGQEGMFLG